MKCVRCGNLETAGRLCDRCRAEGYELYADGSTYRPTFSPAELERLPAPRAARSSKGKSSSKGKGSSKPAKRGR